MGTKMAKDIPNKNPKQGVSYPDPVFFERQFVPLIEKLLQQHGGMENMLKNNPLFAEFALKVITDSKEDYQSWLTKNFYFSPTDINSSFTRMEQACDQKSTPLAGEPVDKTDGID
jgi:hypothetical protein